MGNENTRILVTEAPYPPEQIERIIRHLDILNIKIIRSSKWQQLGGYIEATGEAANILRTLTGLTGNKR